MGVSFVLQVWTCLSGNPCQASASFAKVSKTLQAAVRAGWLLRVGGEAAVARCARWREPLRRARGMLGGCGGVGEIV